MRKERKRVERVIEELLSPEIETVDFISPEIKEKIEEVFPPKTKLVTVTGEQLAKMINDKELFYEKSNSWEDTPYQKREGLIEACEEILEAIFDPEFSLGEEFPESTTLGLSSVYKFIESYIGTIIVGGQNYREDEREDFGEDISGKIIAGIEVVKNSLVIELSTLSGVRAGFLKLSPTNSGEFIEKFSDEGPEWSSIYRIDMFGGHSLEYLDTDDAGSAVFFDNQKEVR